MVGNLPIAALVLVVGHHPVERHLVRTGRHLRNTDSVDVVGELRCVVVVVNYCDDNTSCRRLFGDAAVTAVNLE